jgi:hypothetical protein
LFSPYLLDVIAKKDSPSTSSKCASLDLKEFSNVSLAFKALDSESLVSIVNNNLKINNKKIRCRSQRIYIKEK